MSDTSTGAPNPALDLRVPPEWDAVKAAWAPCRAMLAGTGLDEDEAYQLAMVAQELLENGRASCRERV